VKLADFGIARLFGNTQLTTAGGVLGTADYMSPEQADGRPVTARCDQYSLGGVMYTLLAGRPPFQAKSLPQMLQLQRFAKPEPVRRYAADTPVQLERVIMQLLAKNPAERFPNTQVLARHLQAMVNALSRPASDDFALAGEPHVAELDHLAVDPALETEATQLEGSAGQPADSRAGGAASQAPASHDAATMAADEIVTSRASLRDGSAPAAHTAREAAFASDGRSARFTTLAEEEAARRRAEHQRSWLAAAGQLASLLAVLVAMGAAAMFLATPPSADKLYHTIIEQGIAEDDASLANVEGEIEEFLKRFPSDPRAAEVAHIQEQITLDKAERRLQREARGGGIANSPLLPVERLYVRAVSSSDVSPDRSIATLSSIVDLYGVTRPDKAPSDASSGSIKSLEPRDRDNARESVVVELAKRRIAAMKKEINNQRAAQLAALGERLKTAERLSSTDSAQAMVMYRAIVDLYQHETWARDVVATARERLAEFE
jgi:serine/threonine-protein kinase